MFDYDFSEYEAYKKLLCDPRVKKEDKKIIHFLNDDFKRNSCTNKKEKDLNKNNFKKFSNEKKLKIETPKNRDERMQKLFRINVENYGLDVSPNEFKEFGMIQYAHIKPQNKCSEREKIDGYNGIILPRGLHVYFDKGLFSWSHETGEFMLSQEMPVESIKLNYVLLQEFKKIKIPITDNNFRYWEYRNKNIFKK